MKRLIGSGVLGMRHKAFAYHREIKPALKSYSTVDEGLKLLFDDYEVRLVSKNPKVHGLIDWCRYLWCWKEWGEIYLETVPGTGYCDDVEKKVSLEKAEKLIAESLRLVPLLEKQVEKNEVLRADRAKRLDEAFRRRLSLT